jgi:hypothetical protein
MTVKLAPPMRLIPQLANAKRSFCARRAEIDKATLLGRSSRPEVGSLVLSEVISIGQHQRIELEDGRRSKLFVGDQIITCYGHRYAPDQYEVTVPNDLRQCALATSGGVTGIIEQRHDKMAKATQILPIGLLADMNGKAFNLSDFRLAPAKDRIALRVPVIVVLGTSMNAGKTTTAAHLINGLHRAGLRAAAAKVTGTGSGADYWHLLDAGACVVRDFSDCGYPSTYRIGLPQLQDIFSSLLAELQRHAPDIIVLEISDGLYQRETAMMIDAPWFRESVDGVLFAAPDAMSMVAGIESLQKRYLPVIGLSGMITMSPLAMREARAFTDIQLLTIEEFQNPEVILPLVFSQMEQKVRLTC